MIDARDGRERHDRMAVLADLRGQRMRRGLPNRSHVVVAFHAVARDVVVIEVRRSPGRCRVAVVARVSAGNVIGDFTCCCQAVMAGAAGSENL